MIKNYSLLLTIFYFSVTTWGQNNLNTYLFIGSMTKKENSEGIYVYNFNIKNGEVNELERKTNLTDPSFITISPNKQFLFASTNIRNKYEGKIAAFKIDSITGKLQFINKQVSGGTSPCHVVTDKTGTLLINSNYNNSSISSFTINENGSLNPATTVMPLKGSSIHPKRQKKSHLHSTNFSPDNKFVYGFDLGTDKINTFSFNNKSGKLKLQKKLTVNVAKGSGPRHFTFHPTKPYGYCINELNGTITSYTYHNGKLTLLETVNSYSEPKEKYRAADIHISPDGNFLYASNRETENSISIFKLNTNNGKLLPIGHQNTLGETPRNFVIDPTGSFLLVANKSTNEVVIFKRNVNTGKLTPTKNVIKIHQPTCLKMVQYKG